MGTMASQTTSLMIVYSTVHSGADQRKQQSSASLVSVREIHRWSVNSPHKWPATWKMFSFDDVIMGWGSPVLVLGQSTEIMEEHSLYIDGTGDKCLQCINTLRPRQNGRHFPDIINCIRLNKDIWISNKVLLKYVPCGVIDNKSALVHMIIWTNVDIVHRRIYVSLGLSELIN